MTRTPIVLCLAASLGLPAAASAADKWTMLRETEVSIGYGPTELETWLSVTCTSRQSEVYVHVEPGTKPPAEAPVLVVKEGGATHPIKLEVYVCGQPAGCAFKPSGDVATYVARSKGRAMALRFAEKTTSVEIDAPGAKVSAVADRAVFRRFAAACRKWK